MTAVVSIFLKTAVTDVYKRQPDRKALCHWHDDLEFIKIIDGEMNYYINGKNLVLKEHDGIMAVSYTHLADSAGNLSKGRLPVDSSLTGYDQIHPCLLYTSRCV